MLSVTACRHYVDVVDSANTLLAELMFMKRAVAQQNWPQVFLVAAGGLYLSLEVFDIVMVQWLPIQEDLSLLSFIQPLQEADTGSLATAGGTHQRRQLPGLHLKGN